MKLIFVIFVISILTGIDGSARGRVRNPGRQLPFAGQPDATENPWVHQDLQKVERKPDETESSAAKNLDDTVVVADIDTPLSESPNAGRLYTSQWSPDAIDEVPQPIQPVPYPPFPQPQQPQQPKPQLHYVPQTSYYPRPPTQPPQETAPPPPQNVQTPPPQNAPASPPGCLNPRGQFPSQNSCANYLNCWDDVVIEQQCPNGLLFNDITGLCDFEHNVNCGSRPAATPKPSLPPGSKRCPDPNGRYRSSANCSVFYVCLAGSPIKFSCPRGLVYNDEYSVCDYVYNVDCQGSATPKPEPLPRPEPAQLPPQSERPDPTYPPNVYDSPWFRSSDPDAWHQRPVSSQAEIDMKEENLQNQSNDAVDLDTTETPTISSPWDSMPTIPAELAKVPCENGAVHRLDDACSSVVVCRDQRPQLVQCPQGQTYDRPSDSCQHFSIAKC